MSFFVEGNGSICFEVSLEILRGHNFPDGYSWSFASCTTLANPIVYGTYIQKCCVLPGEHIFTCKSYNSPDWSQNTVHIKGNRFCDDVHGFEAMFRLNYTGTYFHFKRGKNTFTLYFIQYQYETTLSTICNITELIDSSSNKLSTEGNNGNL